MRYLILINHRLLREASCLEHASLALKDLQPHARADVVREDGLEWHMWDRSRKELIKQPLAWVIRSESEGSYWSNADGWIEDLRLATRFTENEVPRVSLPKARDHDAAWAPVTMPLVSVPG